MIATLTGAVEEKLTDYVIIEAGGVGYGVAVTANDYESLGIGETVRMYIYEAIREDGHDLYGFMQANAKDLFQQLVGVSGVGPKAALAVLSIGPADQVRSAIAAEDIAYLQAANGIGKRTAERIAVELKSKVGTSSYTHEGVAVHGSTADTAVEALVALGYPASQAREVLSRVSRDLSDEERIKQALKELG